MLCGAQPCDFRRLGVTFVLLSEAAGSLRASVGVLAVHAVVPVSLTCFSAFF